MKIIEQTSLFFSQGSSDKEYHCQIKDADSGFVVTFQYGRRGASLQSGTKTSSPVPADKAKKIYDALVASKMSKGYSPGPAGTDFAPVPFANSDKAARVSGYLPQLLNSIDITTVEALLDDDAHVAQPKHDGIHMMLLIEDGVVRPINRKGLFVGASSSIVNGAAKLDGIYLLDGEAIGDQFFCFDILKFGDIDASAEPYMKRLERLISVIELTAYTLSPTAVTSAQKRELYVSLREANAEGIVFKRKDQPYSVGRPNSGGSALKFKFYKTASVRVAKINDQRSIAMELLDSSGSWVGVGNCTIPANVKIEALAAGQICEIRYLYAYPGGSLYQPFFKGLRSDVDPEECTIDQLIYKAELAAV